MKDVVIDKIIFDFYRFWRGCWDKLDEERLCNFLRSGAKDVDEFFSLWRELDEMLSRYKKGTGVNIDGIRIRFEKLRQKVLKIADVVRHWEEL